MGSPRKATLGEDKYCHAIDGLRNYSKKDHLVPRQKRKQDP
jgi:hypothetical protein